MDKTESKVNTNNPFMNNEKTTQIFNSSKTGANFSIDVLTGEQQYDIDNVYELSLNYGENENDFNLEKSLRKLKHTFERATRYCNSRVPSMNRELITKTFDDLLKPTELTSSKYIIDVSKNNSTNKHVNRERKSNSCLHLNQCTTSTNKLKWNKSFFKRASSVNVTTKYPVKNRTQILRQKDIALRYKQYLKPTKLTKNIKPKMTYVDKLKSFERSMDNQSDAFKSNKKLITKRVVDSPQIYSKINTQKQVSPATKLNPNNLSKRTLSQKKLIHKILNPITMNSNTVRDSKIIFNKENKYRKSTITIYDNCGHSVQNKVLGLNESTMTNNGLKQMNNLSNFSTHTVNTIAVTRTVKSESIQTDSVTSNNNRPTIDAHSQTSPIKLCSHEFCDTSMSAEVKLSENKLKTKKSSNCLHFHDIEQSFKNICSVLSINSLLINKNKNEYVDSNKYTKDSTSSLNILQVYGINTDNLTNNNHKLPSKVNNDCLPQNCHLTVEEKNLSLEQIHLNKTKILNMQICHSNEESIKISQFNSSNNKSKSSEKSCPSSSDELYQVIRSKIDRVLSGQPSFPEYENVGDVPNMKKQHREEMTKIVNEKNCHYLSKSLSKDSFEVISKCGKHSKFNNSCKLIKTLAYRIQRLEMQALQEQGLRLKQQKRLELLESYLRDLYMLSLSEDKTAVKTLAAIKEGFCDLNGVRENKLLSKAFVTLPKHSPKRLLTKALQYEMQYCNASK